MPIKYDDYLKRPGQEFEYSLSHVEELDRCMNDITYYLKYVKIIHPDHGRIKFQPREFQKTILETIKNHNQVCCLISRQSGKTTIISIYALWFAIFNPDKFIGIVSNKQSSAVDILGRIKTMYEELPLWLKPGVVEWSKLSVKFDNGTQIVVSATSADAFRGRTLNLLFCDEIAFVRKGIAEDFWAANFPTMSASEEAKIVIISCVAGNTYVFTDKGPKQIVDFDNNKLGPKTVYPYNVVGKNKINSGNLFVNSGIAKTKIIETTSSKLEGSLNHKLWGCKNGKYNWYKLSELSIGDFISIQYGMDIWGNNDNISFEFNSMKYNKKNKIIDRKLQKDKQLKIDKITSDWAYLFGLYISEGYSDKYRLCISCGDDISWIFKKLNIKYSCFDNMHYNIESIAIVELLKFVGFDITRKAPQKIIPKRLLEMSRENIIALLQGIFDGDGWSRKDNGKIGIGLSSKELIDQIRMLLLNFGILTEYQEVFTTIESSKGKVKSNTTQYRIYTSVNGSKKFYKTIGFKLERKQNKNIALPVKDNVCKTDIIPYANIYLKKYSKVLRDTIIINRKKNIEHLSKNFVIKIFDVLKEKNIPVDDDLQLIYDSSISENIKWEKIKSIEDSENIVYDFSLPDIKNDNWCHSVLYNGYIGHQTPNGPFNLFHRLYTQAERGENTFIPLKYNWKCVPERDEKWATDQRKNLGKLKFEQEHEVDFIGSINTIVDKDVLEKLYFGVKEPITREMTGKLLIYEKPIEGSRYVIGADTAKGTGEHHSALQVCKIISTSPAEFQQVATFFDNRINVFKFADLINKLSIYYNDAFMMVENNAEGSAVVNRLWWDYENEGLVNSGSKESQLGIRATKNTRPRAVTLMKKLVEDEKVHIVDKETVDELTSFIEENGKFKGKDMPDDIISALYWCLFIVEMDVFEEKATLTRDTHDAEEWEEVWGIITDGDSENNFDWLISESKLID